MRDAAIKPFPVDVTEIMEICQELLGIVFELGFFKTNNSAIDEWFDDLTVPVRIAQVAPIGIKLV